MEGERKMQNEFKEEVEALETLKEYNKKVVKALKEIVPELKGDKKEDTDEYLQHILKGVNWEIQVLNGTMNYLNREKEVISKEKANKVVITINEAVSNKDNQKIAQAVEEGLLPFLEKLNEI